MAAWEQVSPYQILEAWSIYEKDHIEKIYMSEIHQEHHRKAIKREPRRGLIK